MAKTTTDVLKFYEKSPCTIFTSRQPFWLLERRAITEVNLKLPVIRRCPRSRGGERHSSMTVID
jgi:hypothetical protein